MFLDVPTNCYIIAIFFHLIMSKPYLDYLLCKKPQFNLKNLETYLVTAVSCWCTMDKFGEKINV